MKSKIIFIFLLFPVAFSAGMYLYALIVDGTVIDTKRMILTK